MKTFKTATLIFVTFLVTNNLFSADVPNAKKDLRKQAEFFYAAWSANKPESVWDLTNPAKKIGVNYEKYIADLRVFFTNTKLVEFKIKGVKESEDFRGLAIVKTNLVLQVRNYNKDEGSKKISMKDPTRWIRDEDGQWFLDGPISYHEVLSR